MLIKAKVVDQAWTFHSQMQPVGISGRALTVDMLPPEDCY